MKKIFFSSLMVLTAAAVAVAQQSLGDVARKERAQKHGSATVRLEGDGLSVPDRSQSGASNRDTPDNADAQGSSGTKADAKDNQSKKGSDSEKQRADEWNAKIDAQKREVALLQRELDVAQREQRMRTASYFGDPNAQAVNQAKYMDDNRKDQQQIEAKKRALDEAQQKLDDLQEQARKSGVRASQ